ncbi:MAG: 30S ribosomal protein S4 [bacterium]|nr:30S ribosomal protein S4 [bacterium]
MAVYNSAKCKVCRRVGDKLFLKGERCNTVKCALTRRAYPPGHLGKNARVRLTEYGSQLREKQKVRKTYGVLERQFVKYLNEAVGIKGDTAVILLNMLEFRLDNIVYRSGLASSRSEARLLVNHDHFNVNGKKVNIPSYRVKIGDVISIQEKSKKKNYFKNITEALKQKKAPSWMAFNLEKMEVKIMAAPSLLEAGLSADIKPVIEFYSR